MGVGAHEPFAAEKYISDAKFMQGGGMVYARDFNTIKVPASQLFIHFF